MSYQLAAMQLAGQLAALIMHPGGIEGSDWWNVDAARTQMRSLCRTVLTDVTSAEPATKRGRHGQEVSPIVQLHKALAPEPVPYAPGHATATAAPIDPPPGLDYEPRSAAGKVWREIHRYATLALAEWESTGPRERPQGRQAWALVADIAAVAAATALADRDVGHHFRPRNARTFVGARDGDHWEVEAAARAVLADPAPIAAPASVGIARQRGLPIYVRSIERVPAATSRLAELIGAAHHLTPAAVGSLAAAHGQSLHTLASVLAAHGATSAARHRLSRTLNASVNDLRSVARYSRPLQSLQQPDAAPGRQMQQLRRQWQRVDSDSVDTLSASDLRAVLATVRPSLEVIAAIDQAIQRHTSTGQWYEISSEPTRSKYTWVATNSSTPPRIASHSRTAADGVAVVVTALPPSPGHSVPRTPTPRQVLQDAIQPDEPPMSREP